jgi:hypothetical protein
MPCFLPFGAASCESAEFESMIRRCTFGKCAPIQLIIMRIGGISGGEREERRKYLRK